MLLGGDTHAGSSAEIRTSGLFLRQAGMLTTCKLHLILKIINKKHIHIFILEDRKKVY